MWAAAAAGSLLLVAAVGSRRWRRSRRGSGGDGGFPSMTFSHGLTSTERAAVRRGESWDSRRAAKRAGRGARRHRHRLSKIQQQRKRQHERGKRSREPETTAAVDVELMTSAFDDSSTSETHPSTCTKLFAYRAGKGWVSREPRHGKLQRSCQGTPMAARSSRRAAPVEES